MLILSRRKEQEISIDDGRIFIRVVAINGDKVRLGITAPPDVRVLRSELAYREREVEAET